MDLVGSLNNMSLMHSRYADAAELEALCVETRAIPHVSQQVQPLQKETGIECFDWNQAAPSSPLAQSLSRVLIPPDPLALT